MTIHISYLRVFGRAFRSLVIEMVLATDMSSHFQQLKQMKTLVLTPEK